MLPLNHIKYILILYIKMIISILMPSTLSQYTILDKYTSERCWKPDQDILKMFSATRRVIFQFWVTPPLLSNLTRCYGQHVCLGISITNEQWDRSSLGDQYFRSRKASKLRLPMSQCGVIVNKLASWSQHYELFSP